MLKAILCKLEFAINMFKYLLLFFVSFTVNAIPTQFCIEMYPLQKYTLWQEENYDEITGRQLQWDYIKVQLSITNKRKDSNGYINFIGVGHAHNRIGDEVAVTTNGYQYKEKVLMNIIGSLVQYTQGKIGTYNVFPVYEINVVARLDKNFDGIFHMFNDITNVFLIKPNETGSERNDFVYGRMNRIPCNEYKF